MGMLFGMVFGIMDMEDVSARFIKEYLMKEENYCIPIGVILGAIAGLFVSYSDSSVSFFKFFFKIINFRKHLKQIFLRNLLLLNKTMKLKFKLKKKKL